MQGRESTQSNRRNKKRSALKRTYLAAGTKPAAEAVRDDSKPAVGPNSPNISKQPRKLAIENKGNEFSSRYQSQTLRPMISLAFVFPLILVYEMGAIYWGNSGLRSGIDQWFDRMVSTFGLGQQVILPLMTAAILVIWHHRIRDDWKFQGRVLTGMILEALVLGTILFCAASACHQFAGHPLGNPARDYSWLHLSGLFQRPDWWSATIASIGSGIYEELLFRLLLLLPAIELLRRLGLPQVVAMVGGIFLVSLLFTSLHYDAINPAGAAFEPRSFMFRFTVSVVFCFLFLFRGFGIAVGTHVAYDILAQL